MIDLTARWQPPFSQRAAAGADSAEIGALAVAAWRGVDAALSPIIGRGGVAALYERSLHLASVRHPSLIGALDGGVLTGDFAAIGRVLSASSGADAAVAHGALLASFCGLLAALIGNPLAARLLHPVWDPLQSGDPAKDHAS